MVDGAAHVVDDGMPHAIAVRRHPRGGGLPRAAGPRAIPQRPGSAGDFDRGVDSASRDWSTGQGVPAVDTIAGEVTMLFYCAFTWYPGTTRAQVAQRLVQQHDAGENHPERIRGWYNLAGGGAGFLLVEVGDPRDLTAFLQPYMDLMSWDVRAITENDYASRIEELRQVVQQTT